MFFKIYSLHVARALLLGVLHVVDLLWHLRYLSLQRLISLTAVHSGKRNAKLPAFAKLCRPVWISVTSSCVPSSLMVQLETFKAITNNRPGWLTSQPPAPHWTALIATYLALGWRPCLYCCMRCMRKFASKRLLGHQDYSSRGWHPWSRVRAYFFVFRTQVDRNLCFESCL